MNWLGLFGRLRAKDARRPRAALALLAPLEVLAQAKAEAAAAWEDDGAD